MIKLESVFSLMIVGQVLQLGLEILDMVIVVLKLYPASHPHQKSNIFVLDSLLAFVHVLLLLALEGPLGHALILHHVLMLVHRMVLIEDITPKAIQVIVLLLVIIIGIRVEIVVKVPLIAHVVLLEIIIVVTSCWLELVVFLFLFIVKILTRVVLIGTDRVFLSIVIFERLSLGEPKKLHALRTTNKKMII